MMSAADQERSTGERLNSARAAALFEEFAMMVSRLNEQMVMNNQLLQHQAFLFRDLEQRIEVVEQRLNNVELTR